MTIFFRLKLPTLLLFLISLSTILAAEEALREGHSHAGEAFNEGPRQAAKEYSGTGDVDFPVTTAWDRGQKMFNQGVGQLHGFWYYEAERTFRQIAAEDPGCAMAYWGMAMANWENTERAKEFIAKAMELKDTVTPREQLWITAQAEYLGEKPKELKARRRNLIRALENIIHEHPEDIEAKAFLLVRLWDFSQRGIPIASYEAIDALLEQVFAENPLHPAHHYRIHHWDYEKPERALKSAAVLHATAPTIAHMWHMPGHIYDKLNRYPESAYHQEASARIDHRHQAETRVMPDTIHNYVHNNEWLVRNWNHVGRASDAIAMAKSLIANPMHPELNHYGVRGSSAYYGRQRLFETLERYECWDEILELTQTDYLPPTDEPKEQVERLLRIGRAHFERGDRESLVAVCDFLEPRFAKLEAQKSKETAEAKAAAKKDGKNGKETKRSVRKATNKTTRQFEHLRETKEELTAYVELLDGEALDEDREDKIRREDEALAMIYLRFGYPEDAKELAEIAVEDKTNEVVPLAVLAAILESSGDGERAEEVFQQLREISGELDMEARPFVRLAKLAERVGAPTDWRISESWRGEDFGDKPEDLEALGPLMYEAPLAADFDFIGEDGSPVRLEDFEGRPVVVLLYLGHNCAHCVEQLNAFTPLYKKFENAGIEVIAASPEAPEEVGRAHALCDVGLRFPFPLCSDEGLGSFKAYHAFDDFEGLTMHGTYLIGPEKKLLWSDVGPEPFMDVEFLLEEAQRLIK